MSTQRQRISLTVALAAALAVAQIAGAAEAPTSLCATGEQVLFSCDIGGKTGSVCASASASAKEGFVQYRFGNTAGPEITYPVTKDASWRAVTRSGVLTYSGGGGAYLAFTKGDFRYVVYTAIGKGWGEKAGVVVEHATKRIADLRCTKKESSELGPDLFTKLAIPDDTRGFEPNE